MRAEKWMPYFEGGDDTPRIVKGVAIVHQASDYALEMQPNGLNERERVEWCERLASVLNDARRRGQL
jgi:hypothetical protein